MSEDEKFLLQQQQQQPETKIVVQIDRFYNRNKRCLMFCSVATLSCLTVMMLMSLSNRQQYQMDQLLETNWQAHWSNDKDEKASKMVIGQTQKQGGKRMDLDLKEQTMVEFLDDYSDDDDYDEEKYFYDEDEGVEYYGQDEIDQSLDDLEDYEETYNQDVAAAKKPTNTNKDSSVTALSNGSIVTLNKLFAPIIRDYSLMPNFSNPFKSLPKEYIEFDATYTNPCWAETIPKFPYVNNSYLLVSSQARELEPEFQMMRQRFATRQSPDTRWRVRCLPAFYVMEMPPLASPGLYTVLSYHPKVVAPRMQEPEYWNHKGPDGIASFRDYVDLFDAAAQQMQDEQSPVTIDGVTRSKHTMITGDATSSYLWTFDSWKKVTGNEGKTEPQVTAADIIFKMTPLAKFVFMLRNPTDRLFSGYVSRTESPSASDFHQKAGEALNKMTECEKTRSIRSCIYDGPLNKNLTVRLRIGMYYPFLADWLRVFPREQIMVVRYEDYVSRPSEVINKVCNFLALPPFPITDIAAVEERIKIAEKRRLMTIRKYKMLSTTRAMLDEFHRKLNTELAALLDNDLLTWSDINDNPVYNPDAINKSPEERIKKKAIEKQDINAMSQEIKMQREQVIAKQKLELEAYKEKRRNWAKEQEEIRKKNREKQTGQKSPTEQQQQQQPNKQQQ